MTKQEYLQSVKECPSDRIAKIEAMFGKIDNEVVRRAVSICDESIFLDDNSRVLTFSEIIDAGKDLQVDFVNLGLIPIIDCGDNDFIVYHVADDSWSKFNIVDKTEFRKQRTLDDVLLNTAGAVYESDTSWWHRFRR